MDRNSVEVVIKARVNPEIANWLKKAKDIRQKGNVTSLALEFFHDYKFYRKGFFIRLMELHFEELKLLLRRVGKSYKRAKNL